MNAADPTARSAFALDQLLDDPADMLIARLLLLNANGPANPLIACQRSQAVPFGQRSFVCQQSFAQVGRQLMHHALGNFFTTHIIYTNPATLFYQFTTTFATI